MVESVCEPKAGVGSRGMRGAGEPLLLPPVRAGLWAGPGSLVAAVSPLACRSSRNFLGVLSRWMGSFPIVTFCVKEYFVAWHVYSNSSRLFSHSYEFL